MAADEIARAAERWLGLAVADRPRVGPELVQVCGEALEQLVSRLRSLDYPVDPMIVSGGDLDAVLAELEETGHAVPPALVEVWRQIGGIQLVDLGRYRHTRFWEDRLGGDARAFACDGVVVEGDCADEGWVGYLVDHLYELADEGEQPAYPIAPDNLHKDDVSGGDPYELVPYPEDPWMASLRGFSWCGPGRPTTAPPGSRPDLVSYLRTAVLECGGFPGLFGSAAFEPLRLELVDGLPVF